MIAQNPVIRVQCDDVAEDSNRQHKQSDVAQRVGEKQRQNSNNNDRLKFQHYL